MLKYCVTLLSLLWLALPLNAANVLVAPGEKISGDVEGTVLLLAGEHHVRETVEITKSLTLTAEPGAVWISHANPAIAVRANDVTIQNLVLKSAESTGTAIVSSSPVTLKRPAHRFTCASNKIEGFAGGIMHVYGNEFVARDNEVIGVEAPVDANELLTVGILNTMGHDAVIEENRVSRFATGIFLSGGHGRVVKNTLQRNNIGVIF